jgi:hypothetical protein
MSDTFTQPGASDLNVSNMSPVEIEELLHTKDRQIVQLRRRIAWFERQIFGQKSERRLPEAEGIQATLGETFDDA